jgi:integral membrane protein
VTSGALTRFRLMAYATGVVLAFNCVFGLSFWPWYVGEGVAGVLWTTHGWLYVLYVVTAFQLAYQRRWGVVKSVLVLLAGTVPFMSFVAERRVVHELRPAPGQEQPAPAPRA